jgi:hypothetical protein
MMKIALAMEIIRAIERVFDRIKPNAINPVKGTITDLAERCFSYSHKVPTTPCVVN